MTHLPEVPSMRHATRFLGPRLAPLAAGLAVVLAAAALGPAPHAGELTLAWKAAGPESSTRYRIFVGESPGVYDRVVEAASALSATVTDLEDGKLHYFAVKALDGAGHASPDFSPELACMARPRLDAVEAPALAPGGSGWVTLRGANFDRDVRVLSLDPRLAVRATTLEADGRLTVLVEASVDADGSGDPIPAPGRETFSLVNPCRRAVSFFAAHPQIADVDGSGVVDEADVRAVSAAVGARRGESGYRPAADLDGDGLVDGSDLERTILLSRSR